MTATAHDPATATEPASRDERFVEHVAQWRSSEVVVDRSAGTIRNILLVGPHSRNGYRYKAEALREAVDLYEGKLVFLDHAADPARPRQRSTRDVAGTLVRPRFVGGRLRGDIATVDTEAGRTLLALAERDRPGVGMSHVVLARRNDDGSVVEKIVDVVSVDAVVFPATARSFREQQQDDDATAEISANGNGQATTPPPAACGLAEISDNPATPGLLESRLTELADGLERLLEQIFSLLGERDRLRSEAERRSADDQRRARRARVEQIVEECRLSRDTASDVFLDLLANCEDETLVRTLIEDRRRLTEVTRRPAPRSRERNGDGTTDPSAALIAAITGRPVPKVQQQFPFMK